MAATQTVIVVPLVELVPATQTVIVVPLVELVPLVG